MKTQVNEEYKLKHKAFYNIKATARRVTAAVLALAMLAAMLTGCKKEEEVVVELTPAQIVQEVFRLTAEKDYDSVASYCRSFSPYSVELYFRDTDTQFEQGWTERYSKTLAKLFDSYVTYSPNMKETLDKEARTGTVTVEVTSIDLDKFNQATDSKINSELKNDFYGQMDYIDSVITDSSFKSEPFTLDIEFRYKNEKWVLAQKNFLLLLTLGYYNEEQS